VYPFATLLSRLLAGLLLLQVAVAPSLCLARAAQAAQGLVEICTADGIRLVHLADDGTGEAPAPAAHDAFCPLCHAVPHAADFAVPVLPTPAWIAAPVAWAAPGLAAPPPAIRGPPSGPRAPPSRLS
jgi:hypothetical protein